MKKEHFEEMMNFRHACKIFDENKKISPEDMDFILKMGILSPSSFGMEAWKFLVIQDQNLKDKLRPFCWNQAQISTCSHLLIILSGVQIARPESEFVKSKIQRKTDKNEEAYKSYLKRFSDFMEDKIKSDESIFAWSAKQSYIAAANMMNAAAWLKIDSCPIEGFEKQKLEECLKIDTKNWQISLVLPFGYRLKEQQKRYREEFSKIVEFIN